jgi:hypothetical protein
MTLRTNFWRAVSHLVGAVLPIAIFGALWKRWQEGQWPDGGFYFFFLPVLVFLPLGAWIAIIPRRITLTEDSLTIAWPFQRDVSCPVEELEYFIEAQLFMLQLENHRTQFIYSGGFARKEWRAFIRELETRFPERKALAGPLMIGRRKP